MTTPIDTMHLRTACERTAEMQESFKAADAIGCGLSVAESLMGACADLSTHVPSIIALLDEVERLRARVGRLRQGLDDVIEAVSDGITAPADEARRALELDDPEEGGTR